MNGGWHDRDNHGDGGQRGMLTLGLFLVLMGILFLVSEQTGFDFNRYGWPMFVVVPGVLLLAMGLSISNEGGLGAAIPGALITSIGLILAFQEATGAYASWAYAWALVAPGSVGVALVLWGVLHRRGDLVESGMRSLVTGLGLFVGFGLLFENVLGLDDGRATNGLRNALPLLAVGLGVAIVIWNLLPYSRRNQPTTGQWLPPTPPTPPTPPAG
ncbi:MAG TPA: hypothetical protein VF337_03555 [Candidatus Limnocylindrales bacterium]